MLVEVEGKNIFSEHFGIPGNRNIYNAMMYLKGAKQMEPTPMAIMEVLNSGEAKKSVEELGGLDYLILLTEMRIPEDNIGIFVEKIKQAYTRRQVYNAAGDMQRLVLSEQSEVMNPSEIIGFAEQKLVDIGVNTASTDEAYKMGDDTERVLTERAETPDVVPGLEVGWAQYDRVTNGALGGDLIIVVAPSKTGKSVTLTNWAKKIGITDKLPVLYLDSEMSGREQEDRLLANLSGIPHHEIVSGLYVLDTEHGTAAEKMPRLKKAREELNMGNYYHVYMPQFTIEAVTSLARKFQMQYGIVALFFDYIKIPSNQANFRDAQEYQRLGFFTSGLKDIAGMLKIPVFTAAQTNRSNTGTEDPSESDIGGSYRILQLATKLMFLYNKSAERIAKDGLHNGNQQLFIKWQRNGESDCAPININFDKPILRQTEA